jgi:hypothetical protein
MRGTAHMGDMRVRRPAQYNGKTTLTPPIIMIDDRICREWGGG